ncbi:hypothetical protein HOD08_02380 [bacterium]|nr:hypothetical protein [bacterium]
MRFALVVMCLAFVGQWGHASSPGASPKKSLERFNIDLSLKYSTQVTFEFSGKVDFEKIIASGEKSDTVKIIFNSAGMGGFVEKHKVVSKLRKAPLVKQVSLVDAKGNPALAMSFDHGAAIFKVNGFSILRNGKPAYIVQVDIFSAASLKGAEAQGGRDLALLHTKNSPHPLLL